MSKITGWLIELWDRLVATDPGLNRLQMASSAAIGVASVLGVEFLFATLTHAGQMGTIISMLLGAVVTMMGMMALTGPKFWPKVRIAVFFPVAIGIGLLCGVLVSGHTDLMLVMFVVIMFAAVVIRQYGIPFFFYGFMGWMGYFFATFTHATFPMIPKLIAAIVVATVWVLLLSSTLMRTNTKKTLNRTVFAFGSRARTVIRSCADILYSTDEQQRKRAFRRLHNKQIKLSEAALMVEGWSAEPASIPEGQSAPLLRRRLMDVQHIAERIVASTAVLVKSDPRVVEAAGRIAERVAQRDDNIKEDVKSLVQLSRKLNDETEGVCGNKHMAVRQFAEAILEFADLAKKVATGQQHQQPDEKDLNEFEPVVGLFLGNLPGSPAVARDVSARGAKWNPLARLSLVNRQALQVAVAGTLAIIFGRELSPMRYYWAVIAAFVMFTGTATRSETFLKGLHRVIGTLVGLVVAIWVAQLTAGHIGLVLFVIVACIFCGFYLVRISYGYMIFFITIMIGQLYSVMNMFSPGLLVLRLEETAVGAVVGFIVALIFVPVSTRDTIRTARDNLMKDLGDLLEATAEKLLDKKDQQDLDGLMLNLDNRMRQLSLVAKPLTSIVMGHSARVRHRLVLYAAIVNSSRALTIAMRQSDIKAQEELAAACGSMAEIVSEFADTSAEKESDQVKDALSKGENVLFGDLSITPSEIATNPIFNRILHLQRLLQELFDHPADPL